MRPFAFWKPAGGYSPAGLALSGWFAKNYTASPYNGTASAGTSGAKSFTEATNPPSAGGGVATFNGTNQKLTSTALSGYLNSSGWGIHMRVNLTSVPADPGPGGRVAIGSLLCDDGAYFVIAPSASGISVELADGVGAASTLTLACATGSYKTIQIRYNLAASGLIEIRVDGGAWSSQAYGAIGSLTGVLKMGTNYNNSAFAAFAHKATLISAYAPSDAECNNIASYLASL